ncbi:GNAT family N-acetyltransferase [Actinomycetospora sp. TBRC 11914]|uniref:GNAT family N-acetyltransferase n=1 Tax=Actinomycetospora sp. TBRC 11914 TaxID=2729387 RepID=UPI00145F8C7C|nr:GNAT family N-acetyltransferase [Actinomycetospora sp. TBRC 11914]NMO91413.1 GNAT family N-acetyltransferase [Actinomycetospora sp. TBRC 11914]
MSTEVLTTGWEPGVPADDTITRRFVLAYADRIAAMASRTGGRQKWVDGARMADLRSPFGYDNAVVVTRPLAEAEWPGLLEAAGAFFPPSRWWVVLSVFATPDLTGLGLVRVGHPPLMLRPPGPVPPPAPGLEVRAVTDEATLADFGSVLVAAYGLADVGVPAIADLALARSLLHLRVGYVDGVPVATAGAVVHHGIVEVDWVATLPGLRRRGYGAAVTSAVVDLAPELPSVLVASDDGQGVYRRLGYLDLFRTTMWEHPPSW